MRLKGAIKHYRKPSLLYFLSGNKIKKQKGWYPFLKNEENRRKLYRKVKDKPFRDKIQKRLQFMYARHILNMKGKEDEIRYTKKQIIQFEIAAEKLIKFVRAQGKINPYILRTQSPNDFIRHLFHAIRWFYKSNPIYIGNLCSHYTFNQILPMYNQMNKKY